MAQSPLPPADCVAALFGTHFGLLRTGRAARLTVGAQPGFRTSGRVGEACPPSFDPRRNGGPPANGRLLRSGTFSGFEAATKSDSRRAGFRGRGDARNRGCGASNRGPQSTRTCASRGLRSGASKPSRRATSWGRTARSLEPLRSDCEGTGTGSSRTRGSSAPVVRQSLRLDIGPRPRRRRRRAYRPVDVRSRWAPLTTVRIANDARSLPRTSDGDGAGSFTIRVRRFRTPQTSWNIFAPRPTAGRRNGATSRQTARVACPGRPTARRVSDAILRLETERRDGLPERRSRARRRGLVSSSRRGSETLEPDRYRVARRRARRISTDGVETARSASRPGRFGAPNRTPIRRSLRDPTGGQTRTRILPRAALAELLDTAQTRVFRRRRSTATGRRGATRIGGDKSRAARLKPRRADAVSISRSGTPLERARRTFRECFPKAK